MMFWLFSESRLPVGSSARITLASLASARAMATRCCSPPLIILGNCPAMVWGRPTSSSSCLAFSRAALPFTPESSMG